MLHSTTFKDLNITMSIFNLQASAPAEKVYIAPPPLVVSVESGFKPTTALATLTFSVKNYDGSETRQTIMEGQTVSELTVTKDGTILNRSSKGFPLLL